MELGLLGAFLGGILTLLSPCSVMLLPAFFSYAFSSPAALLSRTGVFYLGLITTLVPLGVLAGTLGAFVNEHRSTLITVASWVVIALGLVMISGLRLPGFPRQPSTSASSGTSNLAIYTLGTVYGVAGACTGPLLGAVITYAALSGNAILGGITLFIFAAGMIIPLLLLALAWGRLPFIRRLARPRELVLGRWRNTWTVIIGGALTVIVGVVLLVTDGATSAGSVLGAYEQFQLESWVLQNTGQVPDWLVLLMVAALAGGIWLGLTLRRRRLAARETASREPAEQR